MRAELALPQQNRGALVPAKPPVDGQAIRAGIRQMRTAREPFTAWAAIQSPEGPGHALRWERACRDLKPSPGIAREDWILSVAEGARRRWVDWERSVEGLRATLAAIPPEAELKRVRDLANAALNAPLSEAAIAQAVAATVDAYLPSRTAPVVVHVESVVDLILADGYPPVVVAEARENLLRSETRFAPSPHAFLQACASARATLKAAAETTERALQAKADLRTIVRVIELRESQEARARAES